MRNLDAVLFQHTFRQVMARDGVKPVRPTPGRKVWRRKDLEAWLDRMAGEAAPAGEANPWLSIEPNPWYR
jgi:hypothetical protein